MHHVILADSIDGANLVGLLLCAGLAVSVVALVGLVPAWQGSRAATLILAAPAFIYGVAMTLYCAGGLHYSINLEAGLQDILAPWLIVAGPPLVSSVLAACCLWFRRARVKQNIGG